MAITNSSNINFKCNNFYNSTNITSLAHGINMGNNMSALDVVFTCDSIATSIRQSIRENSFQVYPNPVKDKLHIRTAIKSYQLEIIDVYGKRIKIVKNALDKVELSGLSTGVYWVIVTTASEKFQRKIIKY
jgi:hypothetical protein